MIEDMPKSKPPGLIHERNRHGTQRWVYRADKRAPRIALTAPYDSAEFWQQYRAAVAGQVRQPPKAGAAAEGSLRWLVNTWRASSDWKATAPATQRQRDNILAHVLDGAGNVPFRAITRQDIIDGRERRQDTPFAANNFLKTMRALFAWAEERQLVERSPAAGVKFLTQKTTGFEPWVAADVVAYRERWPLDTRARLAMEIIYATGLRRGDVVRLGRQHLQDDGTFMIVTEKTGETVFPPMTPALREAIEAGPVGDLVYATGADRKPLAKESLGNSLREWCRAAGVTKSAHGLRKLVVTEAAEAGCTEAELQDMFGWTTIKQSAIYTRTRARKRVAARGWAKRAWNDGSAAPPKGGAK